MPIFSKQLIVYYRDSCHLCEQMVASLFQLQEELEYEIKQIDIDDDSQVKTEIRNKYTADVPVVIFNEEVVCYHFFDEIALRETLAD